MMDPNGQPQMHPAYAYYSSGDEGPVDYVEAAYPHPQMQVPQHQYAIQSANIDMSQMRPQMQQMQMQHPQYAMQPHHPSMQPQVQQVAYDPSRNGMYQHPAVTSPPPPPSPYDAISPAPSVSDHSASGTESTGAPPIRTTGVPIMPAQPRIYHHHSHSSASSTSSLHGEHPYANPAIPYGAPDAALRRHSKTHSLDRHSVERTPPPGAGGQFQASDDDGDFGTMGPMDGYVNQISLLNRKESTRRQRIQAEQRRRDELRDGYARLKDVLPITSSKSSKVSLIERARNHIIDIDSQNANLKSEIEELKKEVARLQQISEKMAMSSVIPFGSVPNNAANAEGGEGNEHPNEGDPATTTTTAVDPGITVLTGPDENDPFAFAKATPTKAEEDETMGTSPARERTPVNA